MCIESDYRGRDHKPFSMHSPKGGRCTQPLHQKGGDFIHSVMDFY